MASVPRNARTNASVTVEKRKWDGTVSARWAAVPIVAHPHASAWFTAAGTIREHPRLGTSDVVAHDEISVAGLDWWVVTASLDHDGRVSTIKADAATPIVRGPGEAISYCDLDLDLCIDGSTVRVLDEEDFVRNARTMGYPPEVHQLAHDALRDVLERYTARRWPFAGAPWGLRLGGAPRMDFAAGDA